MKYYHITSFDSYLKEIKECGLHSDKEGYIYLLTRKDVAGYVALNQLGFMDSFALLEISENGIIAKIEDDNVAEITAKWQKRVKQEQIKPDHIKFENMYHVKL